MTRKRWNIHLGSEAEKDFVRILRYTKNTFGERQAAIYKTTILKAFAALAFGPDVPGSSSRDEILQGIRTLHVARKGRRGRHFVMYRAEEKHVIEVVRILHDAMELSRHIPKEPD
ncbi:MAG: type II toxin-antitoxin system RelE/ParE family toxin [Alphaproteobacteria bacterium]|nr:type II toxin-antitoxin system RelE/ParE family toxin [Alphaproteobacteria bacterium]